MKKKLTKFPFSRAVIEESGLAFCVHTIFQNQNIRPGVLMGVCSPNDPVTSGERAFMLASTQKALEEGGTPIKLVNLSGKKKETSK